MWFADVVLPFTTAYWPFVRLAVARYQPQAIARQGRGLNLSQAVLCDFAQVGPTRTVSVTAGRNPSFRTVTVTGRGIVNDGTGAAQRRSRVFATVERRDNPRDGSLGWVVHRPEVELTPSAGGGNQITWQGPVSVGSPGPERRIVVEEFEMGHAGNSVAYFGPGTARRLVYLDVLPV
jgi:hypothetical protein